MGSQELAQAAKEVIQQLDGMPHDAERAQHKFHMIRIAERHAAGIEQGDTAAEEVLEASAYAGM